MEVAFDSHGRRFTFLALLISLSRQTRQVDSRRDTRFPFLIPSDRLQNKRQSPRGSLLEVERAFADSAVE
jgi:hypothetical protein